MLGRYLAVFFSVIFKTLGFRMLLNFAQNEAQILIKLVIIKIKKVLSGRHQRKLLSIYNTNQDVKEIMMTDDTIVLGASNGGQSN